MPTAATTPPLSPLSPRGLSGDDAARDGGGDLALAWDARVASLLARLPDRITARIHWLRHRDRRALRIVSAVLLVLGGIFSILPVLGIWMLPLGLGLLAEDWPGLKPKLEKTTRLCERLWRRIRPGSA